MITFPITIKQWCDDHHCSCEQRFIQEFEKTPLSFYKNKPSLQGAIKRFKSWTLTANKKECLAQLGKEQDDLLKESELEGKKNLDSPKHRLRDSDIFRFSKIASRIINEIYASPPLMIQQQQSQKALQSHDSASHTKHKTNSQASDSGSKNECFHLSNKCHSPLISKKITQQERRDLWKKILQYASWDMWEEIQTDVQLLFDHNQNTQILKQDDVSEILTDLAQQDELWKMNCAQFLLENGHFDLLHHIYRALPHTKDKNKFLCLLQPMSNSPLILHWTIFHTLISHNTQKKEEACELLKQSLKSILPSQYSLFQNILKNKIVLNYLIKDHRDILKSLYFLLTLSEQMDVDKVHSSSKSKKILNALKDEFLNYPGIHSQLFIIPSDNLLYKTIMAKHTACTSFITFLFKKINTCSQLNLNDSTTRNSLIRWCSHQIDKAYAQKQLSQRDVDTLKYNLSDIPSSNVDQSPRQALSVEIHADDREIQIQNFFHQVENLFLTKLHAVAQHQKELNEQEIETPYDKQLRAIIQSNHQIAKILCSSDKGFNQTQQFIDTLYSIYVNLTLGCSWEMDGIIRCIEPWMTKHQKYINQCSLEHQQLFQIFTNQLYSYAWRIVNIPKHQLPPSEKIDPEGTIITC